MTLDDKVGQLLVSSFAVDIPEHRLARVRRAGARRSHEYRIGGFHVFGGSGAGARRAARRELRHRHARPAARGRVAPQPAAGDRRRTRCSTRADFETGAGFRLEGRDRVSAQHGVRRGRRREARLRGRPDHRRRVARDRRPGELRAGRRRQQQPAQSRSSTRAPTARIRRLVGRLGSRLRPRPAGRRHDRHAEALSRVTATPTSTRISACRSSRSRASRSTGSSSRRSRPASPPAPAR